MFSVFASKKPKEPEDGALSSLLKKIREKVSNVKEVHFFDYFDDNEIYNLRRYVFDRMRHIAKDYPEAMHLIEEFAQVIMDKKKFEELSIFKDNDMKNRVEIIHQVVLALDDIWDNLDTNFVSKIKKQLAREMKIVNTSKEDIINELNTELQRLKELFFEEEKELIESYTKQLDQFDEVYEKHKNMADKLKNDLDYWKSYVDKIADLYNYARNNIEHTPEQLRELEKLKLENKRQKAIIEEHRRQSRRERYKREYDKAYDRMNAENKRKRKRSVSPTRVREHLRSRRILDESSKFLKTLRKKTHVLKETSQRLDLS